MTAVRVSAPGKLILAGEHGVVHGRPALIAAIGRRVQVWVEEREPGSTATVTLELRDVGVHETVPRSELRDYHGRVAQRWYDWERDRERSDFSLVVGEDPAHVVKLAIAEVDGWLGDVAPADSIALRVESELPVGAGLGSSAAVAAAVIGGLLRHNGAEVETEQLEALALEVERMQHGHPSGVDTATAIRGGLLWAEREEDGALCLEARETESGLLELFRIVDTGSAPESTGNVVSAVRRRLEERPELASELDAMAEATGRLAAALAASDADASAPVEPLRRCHRALLALGVVPEGIARQVETLEAGGGAAKISGAGSLRGPGAGALIVYHPDPERLAELLPPGASMLEAGLGAPGLRWER